MTIQREKMYTINILEVKNRADLEIFVQLPWEIYKDAPLWVSPLKRLELQLLDKNKHPFWEKAEGIFFLAQRNNKIVGRIAAIVDHNYNEYSDQLCGAWGFFECENNQDTANALFEATKLWLKEKGMHFMRGPLNPSTNYTCGMLIQGFELAPCIMMPWNHPYLPELVETYGMNKEQDLFAYIFDEAAATVSDKIKRLLKYFKRHKNFTFRATNKKTISEDICIMLDIYKESWTDNWGFNPMSLNEVKQLTHDLKNVIDPEFFILFYYKGIPAGGMIALPDMNALLKRCNGKLGLSTLWHWWNTRKLMRKGYRMLLFGIKAEYRSMGLPLLLLDLLINKHHERQDLEWIEGSWSLESNFLLNTLLEDFGGKIHKKYRIYRHELEL